VSSKRQQLAQSLTVLHFKRETLPLCTQRGTCLSDGGLYVKLKVYLNLFGDQQSAVSKDQAANLRIEYVIYVYAGYSGLSAASSVDDG
jgi:hypothetical protein